MRPVLLCAFLALCVPVAALADGPKGPAPLVGTLTANGSGSVTVAAQKTTLTCAIPDRAGHSIVTVKVGAHVKIACRKTDSGLVLTQLVPLGDKHDSGSGTTPGTGTGDNHGTSTGDNHGTSTGDSHGSGTPTTPPTAPPTTAPPTTTPPTTPPPPKPRSAIGTVFFLSSAGVGLRPDTGGEVLTCAITPAPDSTAAAAKLALNAHVGIVCRFDGGRWVLAGATSAP
jgi:hypothetical protein